MSETATPVTPSQPGRSFTTDDGWTIESNHSTSEEIQKALDSSPDPKKEPEKKEPPDTSTAAAVLGKEGGKAAAAARKIKPIPDRPKKEKPPETPAGEQVEAASPEHSDPIEEDEAERAKREADEEIQAAAPEKRKELASERIREATRLAAEAKREAREALARETAIRAEYERWRYEQRPQQTQEQPQVNKPPFKPEDFESYEEGYLPALMQWHREQWETEHYERARVEAYRAQLDNTVRGFNGRVQEAFGDEFEVRVADWAEPIYLPYQPNDPIHNIRELRPSFALRDGEQATASTVVADEIVASEQAPRLMVYFSEHPEVFQRIATLHSAQAVQREMAKLEAKLEAQAEAAAAGTSAPSRAISKAHPPVRPVTGAPHTTDGELSGDESYDEHVAKMNARERRDRR